MESPCMPPAPGNRRVVRTGYMLADDVIFRCRGRGTGRFHAGAKAQEHAPCSGFSNQLCWVFSDFLLVKP